MRLIACVKVPVWLYVFQIEENLIVGFPGGPSLIRRATHK